MSIITSVITFFSATNFSSIACSLIASLLFEGSKSVFMHIWGGSNDRLDNRLRKYFEATVDKLVVNEGVARQLKERSYDEYLKVVRSKLEARKAYDTKSFLFQDIVDEFTRSVQEDSIFMIQILWRYHKELKSQVDIIIDELKRISEKIDKQTKFLEKINAQVASLEWKSPYSLPVVTVNNENIVLPEGFIKRELLIDDICKKLDENRCVILIGDILVGKTCLAENVGLAKKNENPLLISLNYKNLYNVRTIISSLNETDCCKFVIVDGLPDYDVEVIEDLCKVISSANNKGIKILVAARNFSEILSQKYGFYQYVLPSITMDELRKSVPQCGDKTAALIISTSSGYPMLVNLLLLYLDINNWKLSEQQIIDFISIPNKKNVQDYTHKKIREIISDLRDLQLLSRLSMFWRPFTEEDIVSVASVNPFINTPKERVRTLLSQRLLLEEGDKFKLSPYIKKVWVTDLLDVEYRECSKVIVNRIVHRQTIDTFDAVNAVVLLCNAKEYNQAGWFYITCLSKCLESKNLDASQLSLLTMLWRDMPLPNEMHIGAKTLIRIMQLQIAYSYKENASYALNDLIRLIQEFPSSNPLKSTAASYAIAHLSKNGNFKDAISLMQFAQISIPSNLEPEYLELLNEQKEISGKIPVLMLAGINSLTDLIQWFEKMEQLKIPIEGVDYLAVKVVLNKVVVAGIEEESLYTVINRTKECEAFNTFLIVAVARLMLYYSNMKRFEDCEKLYESYKDLTSEGLGSILINNARACYYYDLKDIDRAMELWSDICQKTPLVDAPEDILFVKMTMANIYSERQDYPSSVEYIRAIVRDEGFATLLDEYAQMQIHGELAVAYWNNGQQHDALKELMILHDYLYANRWNENDDYKLLELNFGICVQQYHYYLEKNVFAADFAVPLQSMFYFKNIGLLEAYNKYRTGTNIMYLYMMSATLKGNKQDALLLAHRSVECFSDLIKDKNVACSLLNEFNPLLLENGEYDKVSYLMNSNLALAPLMTEISNPLTLILYFPLLPLCCKRVIDEVSASADEIDEIIHSLILRASELYSDCSEVSLLKKIINDQIFNAFSELKDDFAKMCVRIYVYDKLDLHSSINVVINTATSLLVHKYYGSGLMKLYVYHHSMYIISHFATNYPAKYKNPKDELEKVWNEPIDDVESTKKMLRFLVSFSREDVQLNREQEEFIGL